VWQLIKQLHQLAEATPSSAKNYGNRNQDCSPMEFEIKQISSHRLRIPAELAETFIVSSEKILNMVLHCEEHTHLL
jgi:hypothetical protein